MKCKAEDSGPDSDDHTDSSSDDIKVTVPDISLIYTPDITFYCCIYQANATELAEIL